MLLNEDLFEVDVPNISNTDIDISELEPTVPEPGPSIGVETMIMQAIKDIYGIIEGYNTLSIELSSLGNEKLASNIADIIMQEHANVGTLQNILKEISPNAEAVDINESLNEELDDIGSKGDIYRNSNKVGEYWYSYGASSYGFNLINGETHHWYSKEDFLDFLKEHNYTTKRI